MKKLLIGAAVGGLILFIWQFLSWAALDLHGSQMAYTPNQDAIMEVLNEQLSEDGQYFLPRLEKGASPERQEQFMKEVDGKPWAIITYHKVYSNSMGMNLIRGYVINFISALFLAWMLMKFARLNMQNAVMASIAVGLIGYFTVSYLSSIWFETTTIPDLIDAIVQWGICGAWLGWWLARGKG
jgi:uncharacterized membrane protein YeaQ/YmgE (transglycosylase-associated protein family)